MPAVTWAQLHLNISHFNFSLLISFISHLDYEQTLGEEL